MLWRTTLRWQRAVRAALEPHDLTHVQFVLLASTWWLVDHDGAPTQAELAEHAATDPMMTSQVVRRLEQRGLIRREPDPRDARARRLELTAAGRAALAGALADVEAVDADFFATLGRSRPAFEAGLRALADERPARPAVGGRAR